MHKTTRPSCSEGRSYHPQRHHHEQSRDAAPKTEPDPRQRAAGVADGCGDGTDRRRGDRPVDAVLGDRHFGKRSEPNRGRVILEHRVHVFLSSARVNGNSRCEGEALDLPGTRPQ